MWLENTKNTCHTEVTRASKSLLLIFSMKSSEIQRSIEFDCSTVADSPVIPTAQLNGHGLSSISFDCK